MTSPSAAASRPVALRRTQFGRAARWLWSIPVYLLFIPLTKVLELMGRWPRMMSRGMARMMNGAESYTPGAHDVLVCSYFKSGTNWTMQIVAQIAHRGRTEFEHIHDIVPWLEMPERNRFSVPLSDERTWRDSPTGLRAVKTHLPLSKLEYTQEARYVCVVRDPKDVFVSGYRFIRSTMLGPLMPSVRRWLDLYLSDDAFCGSWAEHADSCWRRRHEDNVLFLTYEEMKTDLRGTVERIAALMGVDLEPDELESVVRQSTFEHMKSIGHKFDTRGLSPPWVKPRGAMIRRGVRGSAGELLAPRDQRRIDDYWRAELAKIGSTFPFDDVYVSEEAKRSF